MFKRILFRQAFDFCLAGFLSNNGNVFLQNVVYVLPDLLFLKEAHMYNHFEIKYSKIIILREIATITFEVKNVRLTLTAVISSVAWFAFTPSQNTFTMTITTHWTAFCHLKRHCSKEFDLLWITKVVIQWYKPMALRHVQWCVSSDQTLKVWKNWLVMMGKVNLSFYQHLYVIYVLFNHTFKALVVLDEEDFSESFKPLTTSIRS